MTIEILHKKLDRNLCYFLVLNIIVMLFISCSDKKTSPEQIKRGSFLLSKQNDSLHYLSVNKVDTATWWKLPYPVYAFQTGDINKDGVEDALVGVVKQTRFHPKKAKRLFIFKNYKGLVRPLWLGSRLSQPLVDFRFKKTEKQTRIRSVEKEKSGKYLVAEYKWRKFGLEFTRYLKREIDSIAALSLLEN
ncbi:hypothetical protein [Aquimarina sediminis]|uniref:hypothetical protein n=1 Tax=Aquimarina sediminis TaxID=2070536 RepID=UPI0019D4216B|nr:hypothetical protein [Aquimarina sediminis]